MDYVEKARALRADPAVHYNCCQAVLVTFADRLGLTPEQAVYIGDSEIDIQTAENAGLDCLSVTWGFRSKTFLQNHGARFLVDTPEEIAAFF